MQIVISGHHYHVSDNTRRHINAAGVSVRADFTRRCWVVMSPLQKRSLHFALILLSMYTGRPSKRPIRATSSFPVIDGSAKKMVRQLKKLHDRRRKPRVISNLNEA